MVITQEIIFVTVLGSKDVAIVSFSAFSCIISASKTVLTTGAG